ncbi:hypothetical protein [Thermogemmatispora sp.]|uniref:hypothetical protein n=1 Tax=Thermogemmatispora sp. TaxID=1968838 RepID=UPI0035E421D2
MQQTRAARAIVLRERWREQMNILKARYPAAERAERAVGQVLALEEGVNGLEPITTWMPPGQVQTQVERLLDRLAETKAHWLVDERRADPRSHAAHGESTAQAACHMIDELVPALWKLLSPRWRRSGKRHGQYFQVYQSVDLEAMWDVSTGVQRWRSPLRHQFYREVALLKAEGDSPLEEAFRLTNHVEEPWQRSRKILWYARDGPLRSTSVGDIIVSLSSGAAWVVDHVGFQVIAEEDATPQQGFGPARR